MNSKTFTQSIELQALLHCLKIELFDAPLDDLIRVFEQENLDWVRFEKLVGYHKIGFLVYSAGKKIGLRHPMMERLEKNQQQQAFRDLVGQHQLNEIFREFSARNLPILPYKGIVFKDKLYGNQTLRERKDLDVMVLPEHAVESIQLLFSMGYRLSSQRKSDAADLRFLVEHLASSELSLVRHMQRREESIDFHWGMHEFPAFEDYTPELFQHTQIDGNVLSPNPSAIFAMILNHHGGREFWVRLKHLVDLVLFLKRYPEISQDVLREQAGKLRMQTVFDYGMHLLDHIFYDINSRRTVDSKVLKTVFTMWEEGNHWDQLIPKCRLFYIKWKMLDEKIHLVRMCYYEYVVQTGYDLRIPPVIWSKKNRFLNIISKTIFWLLAKFSWYRY